MFRNISWQKVFDHYDAIIISKFRIFLERLEGLIFFKKISKDCLLRDQSL